MNASDDADLSPAFRSKLSRIADMLGYSVDDFVDGGHEPLAMRGASELLTIWAEMDDDADRARLLEFARQFAASQ